MKFGFTDACNYILYDNPVSKGVVSASKAVVKPFYGGPASVPVEATPEIYIVRESRPLWQMAAEQGPFVRLAGLSGALAVALGAYGAHKKYPKDRVDELKRIYETANRMHFFHSLVLLGVPLCRRPFVTGPLFIVGMVFFSGSCYYRAFTGEAKYERLAPIGGTILIVGWLSMIL